MGGGPRHSGRVIRVDDSELVRVRTALAVRWRYTAAPEELVARRIALVLSAARLCGSEDASNAPCFYDVAVPPEPIPRPCRDHRGRYTPRPSAAAILERRGTDYPGPLLEVGEVLVGIALFYFESPDLFLARSCYA